MKILVSIISLLGLICGSFTAFGFYAHKEFSLKKEELEKKFDSFEKKFFTSPFYTFYLVGNMQVFFKSLLKYKEYNILESESLKKIEKFNTEVLPNFENFETYFFEFLTGQKSEDLEKKEKEIEKKFDSINDDFYKFKSYCKNFRLITMNEKIINNNFKLKGFIDLINFKNKVPFTFLLQDEEKEGKVAMSKIELFLDYLISFKMSKSCFDLTIKYLNEYDVFNSILEKFKIEIKTKIDDHLIGENVHVITNFFKDDEINVLIGKSGDLDISGRKKTLIKILEKINQSAKTNIPIDDNNIEKALDNIKEIIINSYYFKSVFNFLGKFKK